MSIDRVEVNNFSTSNFFTRSEDEKLPTRSIKSNEYVSYTGEKLLEEIKDLQIYRYKYRDATIKLINYCVNITEENKHKVGIVSGLRRTGKTIGMFQTIKYLIDMGELSTNIVYIGINKEIDNDFLEEIINSFEDKKYIFIDEVTKVCDLVDSSQWIADMYARFDRRIILGGTDSYSLQLACRSDLATRYFEIKYNILSFGEAHELLSMNLDEYLKTGGIFSNDLSNYESLTGYITTAVVDNIINTYSRVSAKYWPIGDLESLAKMLTNYIWGTAEYMTYEELIKEFSTRVSLSLKNLKRNPDYANVSELAKAKTLTSMQKQLLFAELEKQLHIASTKLNIARSLVELFDEILCSIGFIFKLDNYSNVINNEYPYNYNTFITMPGVVYPIAVLIGDKLKLFFDNDVATLVAENMSNVALGNILEGVVVRDTNLYTKTNEFSIDSVYYYRDHFSREIDMIVAGSNIDCYEIKHSDQVISNQRLWLINNGVQSALNKSKLKTLNIIYTGESKTVKIGDADRLMYQQYIDLHKDKADQMDISTTINTVNYINAEEYLLELYNKRDKPVLPK